MGKFFIDSEVFHVVPTNDMPEFPDIHTTMSGDLWVAKTKFRFRHEHLEYIRAYKVYGCGGNPSNHTELRKYLSDYITKEVGGGITPWPPDMVVKPDFFALGYFGIGIYDPKREENVGSLFRSAGILGASFVFTIGKRIATQQSDTNKFHKYWPYYNHASFDDFYKAMPYGCLLVGIELDDKSVPIETYKHPERCIYLLGSEDNGLPKKVREKCHEIVQLPMGNYNVANAGTIVMYDRHQKSPMNPNH